MPKNTTKYHQRYRIELSHYLLQNLPFFWNSLLTDVFMYFDISFFKLLFHKLFGSLHWNIWVLYNIDNVYYFIFFSLLYSFLWSWPLWFSMFFNLRTLNKRWIIDILLGLLFRYNINYYATSSMLSFISSTPIFHRIYEWWSTSRPLYGVLVLIHIFYANFSYSR